MMSTSESDSVFGEIVLENENFSDEENDAADSYNNGGLVARGNNGVDPLDTLDNALFKGQLFPCGVNSPQQCSFILTVILQSSVQ